MKMRLLAALLSTLALSGIAQAGTCDVDTCFSATYTGNLYLDDSGGSNFFNGLVNNNTTATLSITIDETLLTANGSGYSYYDAGSGYGYNGLNDTVNDGAVSSTLSFSVGNTDYSFTAANGGSPAYWQPNGAGIDYVGQTETALSVTADAAGGQGVLWSEWVNTGLQYEPSMLASDPAQIAQVLNGVNYVQGYVATYAASPTALDYYSLTGLVEVSPEPGTIALLGSGLLGLAGLRKFFRSNR
jgi:hypothetical protein